MVESVELDEGVMKKKTRPDEQTTVFSLLCKPVKKWRCIYLYLVLNRLYLLLLAENG